MSKTASPLRKWAWLSVRILVTIGLLGYVLWKIEWQDSLRLPSEGQGPAIVVRGFADSGLKEFRSGEKTYPMAAVDRKDPSEAYTPGFIRLLLDVDKPLLLLAFLALPVTGFILALRWQWLLQTHGLDPGFFEAVRLTWAGLVANNILPSSIGGDAVKWICIGRRFPGHRVEAGMTVLMDRILGLIALLAVGGIAILATGEPGLERWKAPVWGGLGLLLAGLFVFFSGRFRAIFRVNQILAALPFGKILAKLDNAIFHYRRHPGTMARSVLLSFVLHFWTINCVYILGQALHVNAAWSYYFVFVPLIFTMGAFIPSVGGLGVLEGSFATFFSMKFVGATASSAIALCVLYRIVQILTQLPGVVPLMAEWGTVKKVEEAEEQGIDLSEAEFEASAVST